MKLLGKYEIRMYRILKEDKILFGNISLTFRPIKLCKLIKWAYLGENSTRKFALQTPWLTVAVRKSR
ncbi:MAG: hypothetical protein AB4063_07675 [Crocosphaera sp.]